MRVLKTYEQTVSLFVALAILSPLLTGIGEERMPGRTLTLSLGQDFERRTRSR